MTNATGRAASSGRTGVSTTAAGSSANNRAKATTKTSRGLNERESGRTVSASSGRTDQPATRMKQNFQFYNKLIEDLLNYLKRAFARKM